MNAIAHSAMFRASHVCHRAHKKLRRTGETQPQARCSRFAKAHITARTDSLMAHPVEKGADVPLFIQDRHLGFPVALLSARGHSSLITDQRVRVAAKGTEKVYT